MEERNVARLLTTFEPAALAAIYLHGPQALEILLLHWTPLHAGSYLRKGPNAATDDVDAQWPMDRIRLGHWRSRDEAPCEEVVVCRIGSRQLELMCHGGKEAATRILRDLESHGVSIELTANRVEITRESYESCIIGSPRSEVQNPLSEAAIRQAALEDLQRATTEVTTGILLDQLRGALTAALKSIESMVQGERWTEALASLRELETTFGFGKHLIAPYQVVMVGRPNVGKSSLINAILGFRRSLVHEAPGTTRDVVQVEVYADGWPVILCDTAGIRESSDVVEALGIASTKNKMREADLVMLLVESSSDLTMLQQEILPQLQVPYMYVWTKCDLEKLNADALSSHARLDTGGGDSVIRTSAKTLQGIAELLNAVRGSYVPKHPLPCGTGVIFRKEQFEHLQAWRDELQATRRRTAREPEHAEIEDSVRPKIG